MPKSFKQNVCASVVALTWAAMVAPAFAQAESDGENKDRDVIVVTAQKKAENVQDDSITFLEANSNLVGSFRSAFLLDPRTFGLSLRVGF